MATTIISDNGLNPIGTNTDGVITIPGLSASGSVGGLSSVLAIDGFMNGNNINNDDKLTFILNGSNQAIVKYDDGSTIDNYIQVRNSGVLLRYTESSVSDSLLRVQTDGVFISSNDNVGAIAQIRVQTDNAGGNNIQLLSDRDVAGSPEFIMASQSISMNVSPTAFILDSTGASFSGSISSDGLVGLSATFSSADGTIITITNGIITNIS